MTLEQFIQKYGTDGASLILDKLVDNCMNIEECLHGNTRDLLNEVSDVAKDLKSALSSR